MTIAMTPTTTVTIRRAQAADIPFLGWVMYTAARSHLTTCPWSAIFGTDEAETREILERLAETAAAHWCHVSKFWIAETDGTPAAAMAGFVPAISSEKPERGRSPGRFDPRGRTVKPRSRRARSSSAARPRPRPPRRTCDALRRRLVRRSG